MAEPHLYTCTLPFSLSLILSIAMKRRTVWGHWKMERITDVQHSHTRICFISLRTPGTYRMYSLALSLSIGCHSIQFLLSCYLFCTFCLFVTIAMLQLQLHYTEHASSNKHLFLQKRRSEKVNFYFTTALDRRLQNVRYAKNASMCSNNNGCSGLDMCFFFLKWCHIGHHPLFNYSFL